MSERRPGVGYAMVAVAAVLFAINGTVSKVILASGLSSLRLAEVRATGAALALGAVVALTRRRSLKLRAREVPFLAFFGICGLALVQWFYFLAIHRLAIGIALLIQYLAPLLVALWARLVWREPVRQRVWVALVLATSGLGLVVGVRAGLELDALGVATALAAAAAYATYVLTAERGVRRRDATSLSLFGFLFAAAFWSVVQPWWSFPVEAVDERVSLLGNLSSTEAPVWLLTAWMVVLGTVVPFGLIVASLRHLSATTVGIVAMLEPVVATAVAYAWLDEALGAPQLVGGVVVLVGIALAQTAR